MYPVLERYFEYITSYTDDGLLCVGLGDWNYPKQISFDICPTELTDSCYYLLMAQILAEISIALNTGKESHYSSIAQRTKERIKGGDVG